MLQKMHTGQRLYFKISARNNAGGVAHTTCEMSTYDMTLPTGRVKAGYSSSSDPNEMQASLILTDDSKITQTMVSVCIMIHFDEKTLGKKRHEVEHLIFWDSTEHSIYVCGNIVLGRSKA